MVESVLWKTYSQRVSVDKEASIFSIGGYWANKSTRLASDAFCPFFSSYLENNKYLI